MLRRFIVATAALIFGATVALAEDEIEIPEMVQGSEDAKVEIIEYASFTCPHCATFHEGPYQDLKKDYIETGKVRFVFREVYFDRFGLWASMIARCAGPDRFFGVTEKMFAEQSTWARAGEPAAIVGELRKIGKVAGMTDETLDACLQDADQAQALVSWFQKNADADDISSTPSLVIDGKTYSNMNYADLSAIIEEKLAE